MTSGVNQARFLDQKAVPIGPDAIHQIGSIAVIAPHPDDESLGCGGLIALLRQAGYGVNVLFTSDGSMSHPNSKQYPAERLRQLREAEALEALRVLDVSADAVTFMRQKDTQVAMPDSAGYAEAVDFMANWLTQKRPQTVLIPWRRDPHRDHRASWHQLQGALKGLPQPPRVLEYPIWLWELGNEEAQPRPGEVKVWRFGIEPVMELKQRAIAAHQSQVTQLIDDDPEGFWLRPHLLTYFEIPEEVYLEPID